MPKWVPNWLLKPTKTQKKEPANKKSDVKLYTTMTISTHEELQAGHGITRQHWATRHNPCNCHAITSGENFHMSLGTTTIIAKYWSYVAKKYGQHTVDVLINGDHPTPKLSISYLKEDCLWCYDFLKGCTKGNAKTPAEIIRWRIESYPKTKAKSVLKVLDLIERGEI